MQTVFSHIVQKRFSQVNEDIATDALAFILQSSDHARAGMMKLLRGLDATLPDLTFRTQQTEGSIRPDMWGYAGDEPHVYVESKFWAGLTDNQPVSYLEALASYHRSAILLAVVPEARAQSVWREFVHRLLDAGVSSSSLQPPAGVVHYAQTGLGPLLALTTWPRLLAALEVEVAGHEATKADLAQLRALCDAADSDAFLPISAAEVTDQRLPALVLQLGTVVQAAVERAASDGLLGLGGMRPTASWDRVGRYAKFVGDGGPGCWLGVRFDLWRQHGTSPLWLVFPSGAWGRAQEVSQALEGRAAQDTVAAVEPSGAYCVALRIPVGAERDEVVRSIVARLREMALQLVALPPREYGAEPND